MIVQLRRRSNSVLLSSFAVAFFVAIAFVYYNYTFSKMRFIDFGEVVFYTGDNDVFLPEKDNYLIVFYSSYQVSSDELLSKLNNPKKIDVLMLDFSQEKRSSYENVTHLTTGINNILKTIKLFRIEQSPSALIVKRENGTRYKQATLIEKIGG